MQKKFWAALAAITYEWCLEIVSFRVSIVYRSFSFRTTRMPEEGNIHTVVPIGPKDTPSSEWKKNPIPRQNEKTNDHSLAKSVHKRGPTTGDLR
jgi:hypothetical protein